jgi:hypothetical protein
MKKQKSSKEVKTLTSLEELRAAWGLPELRRQTKDKVKLEGQRQRFLSHHKCPICEGDMKLIEDTNIFYCPNQECQGIKRTTVDEETEETTVERSIAYDILDDKGAKIANNIFAKLD